LIFFFKKKQLIAKRNKINWFLELNQGIDLSIFIFGNFEKSILNNAKKLNKKEQLDIIDIGANMGVHSINFAKTFPQSKIYSIEPTNYAFKKFLKNLEINPSIINVNPFQIFLSNSIEKPKSIYSSWNLFSEDNKHQKHMGILKSISGASVWSLDDFINHNGIKRKTLIKCDVDGHELSVFESGEKYLNQFKPIIIMELAPYLYKENGYDYSNLLNFFKKINYDFYSASSYKKIDDIFEYTHNINDGSSVNIFLK